MRLHNLHYTPVKEMHDLGLMGPDVCYIHMTDLTDEELDWIAESGGKASIAPYVEMLMGHGPPPTGKMLSRGVRPSLSVDVVSSVPGEMFTQMRTALAYDRILEFTDTPDVAFAPKLTHRDVLEFATIDGARSIMLEDRVGSLTPGKQADIVLLNVNAINTAPMVDPIGTIVVFSDTSNVDSVFVAGQRREAQRTARRRRSREDVQAARRVEEPHPRGGRAPARMGGRVGGGDLDRQSLGPGLRSAGRARRPRERRERMEKGSVVVVGGTQGLGRELAQSYADDGHDVVVTGRDQSRAEALRARSAVALAESDSTSRSRTAIAERLEDVGDVEYLVLAAIERDVNKVREYEIDAAVRLVTMKLVGYTEVIHTLLPRYGRRLLDPHLRRPRARSSLPGLDDGHDRQRRRDEPRAHARRRTRADSRQRDPQRHRRRQPAVA